MRPPESGASCADTVASSRRSLPTASSRLAAASGVMRGAGSANLGAHEVEAFLGPGQLGAADAVGVELAREIEHGLALATPVWCTTTVISGSGAASSVVSTSTAGARKSCAGPDHDDPSPAEQGRAQQFVQRGRLDGGTGQFADLGRAVGLPRRRDGRLDPAADQQLLIAEQQHHR